MVDINRNKIKKLDNRQDAKNVNTKAIHSSIENELYFIPLRNNVHKLKDPYIHRRKLTIKKTWVLISYFISL